MPWVKLDDAFPEHPKVLSAGDEAAWMYVCALAYCNRHLTDGFLPSAAVKRLTNHKSPIRLVMKLVDVGLLEQVDHGFVVHDFLDYQPSKAAIETERAGARERMANVRQRSKDVRSNVQANENRTSLYPDPVPIRPDPSSSSSSNGSSNGARHVDEDDDRIDHAIDIHAAWAARTADNKRSYQRTVKANDRHDHLDDLVKLIRTIPDATAGDLCRDVFGMTEVDVAVYDPRRT